MVKNKKIPACMALLETGKGWVLIVAGLNPLGVTEPEKAWGEPAKVVKPELKPKEDVRFRLNELGFFCLPHIDPNRKSKFLLYRQFDKVYFFDNGLANR
jgi:hypothetical protein